MSDSQTDAGTLSDMPWLTFIKGKCNVAKYIGVIIEILGTNVLSKNNLTIFVTLDRRYVDCCSK